MLSASLRQVPARVRGVTLGLLLLGCGEWDDHGAARDFAREQMGCFDVEVERTEAHRFSVEGCERTIDVVCSEGSLHPVCIEVARRGTSGGDDGDDPDENGEVVDLDPSVDEGIDEAPAHDEAPPEEAGPSEAELAIRRGLDARSADILACVDRSSVAVRVNHQADGTLSITLSGDLRSSPEEGCVRAAIGDVRVPSGEPGVVVHLVRSRAPSPSPAPTETLEAPPAEPVLTGTVIEELDG